MKDLLYKISQYTHLDKSLSKSPYWYRQEQYLLPFDGEKSKVFKPKEVINPQNEEPEHHKLIYPEVMPEHIKTRKLTPEEHKEILDDVEKYKDFHWYQDRHKKELEIQEDPNAEEKMKAGILKKYNILRETSVKFYSAYKEANEIYENMLDFEADITNLTYIQLIKYISDFAINNIAGKIAYLFGYGGKHRHGDDNTIIVNYLNKEYPRIFNVNPNTYNLTISRMNDIISRMNNIVEKFEKQKKLLKYLRPKVEAKVQEFLSEPKNIEFLEWMEENFPNYKQDFIKNAIDQFTRDYGSFDIDSINKMKSYKQIYESVGEHVTGKFMKGAKELAQEEIKKTLYDEISKVITGFHKSLLLVLEECTPENIRPLSKFLQRKNILDLPSIIFYLKSLTDKHIKNPYLVENPEELLPKIFIAYNIELLNNLKNYFHTDMNRINNFLYDKNIYDISQITAQNINKLSESILREIIVQRIPGLSIRYGYSSRKEKLLDHLPSVSQLTTLVLETGKLSIDAITNHIYNNISFLPKEFISALVKSAFKADTVSPLGDLTKLLDKRHQFELEILLELLKKFNKFDIGNFLNIYKNFKVVSSTVRSLSVDIRVYNLEYVKKIILHSVKQLSTLDKDLNKLQNLINFIHNEIGLLPEDQVMTLITNPNFANIDKMAISKKVIKAFAKIMSKGGLAGIKKSFGPLITDFKKRKYISKDFDTNIKLIEDFFTSGQEISPASPNFQLVFEATSKLETDLSILEMGDALKELLANYEPKNKKMFRLDYKIGDNLRFRVLRDKDPQILRVGIETDCCQRIGGVGEVAARDSFVNPLSSVLVLEWKDPDGVWKLLAQSYFHYVPKDNGVILDNIEKNYTNVSNSDVDLKEVYAYYALKMKEKLKLNYLLAGKGYSKVDTSQFSTYKMKDDPRTFDDKALTATNRDHYSDFDEHNAMNLLDPKFKVKDLEKKPEEAKLEEEPKKEAVLKSLRRVIFAKPQINIVAF